MLASLRPALLLLSLLFQSTALPSAPAPSDAAIDKTNAAQIASGALHPAVLVSSVVPEFTEQARKQKLKGNVEVSLTVDKAGLPQNVTVIHGLGSGLDEKAIEAVRQYRFRPATRDGKPVATKIYVDVNFQIF